MNDPFLEQLKQDWHSQPVDIAGMQRRSSRRLARLRRAPFATISGLVLTIGLFIWFGISAVKRQDPLLILGALAYFAAIAALSLSFFRSLANRRIERTEGTLNFLRMHRALINVERNTLWGALFVAILFACCCVSVGVMMVIGIVSQAAAWPLLLAWGITSAFTWGWQIRRRRSLDQEESNCARMILAMEEGLAASEAQV